MAKSCDKIEFISLEKAKIILCNKEEFNKRVQTLGFNQANDEDFEKLKKYISLSTTDGTKGKIPVSYHYTRGKKGISRQYVTGVGLQNLCKEIRQTIANDHYIDVDMVNSLPSLLWNYCHLAGYQCDGIKYYVDNREKCLDELMECGLSKDDAKNHLIALIDGCLKTPYKFKWYLNYVADVKHFHKQVKSNPAYEAKFNKVSTRKDHNLIGSVVAEIFQEYENNILNHCEKFLKDEQVKIENNVLVYDGFMSLKEFDKKFNEDFYIAMSQYIKNKTKYEVKYITKPMERVINLLGLEFDEDDEILKKSSRIADNDDVASDMLLDALTGQIFFCDGQMWLKCRATKTYVSDEPIIVDELINRAMLMKINKPEGKEFSGNYSGARSIAISTINKIRTMLNYRDDTFVTRMISFTRGKLFFRNGYIDFDTGKWIIEKQDDDVLTPLRICYDLPNIDNLQDEVGNELINRVLLPIFGTQELLNNYLQHIARAVSGHIEDKDWLIMSGMRNCGKGVLTLLNKHTFGDYVNETSANNFLIEKCHTLEDPKKYAWLKRNHWTRILHTSEVKFDTDDRSLKIDGNLIKNKLSSGGDSIEVRDLYEQMIRIQPQCRLFMMCNDVPPITPPDAIQTLSKFSFPSQFIQQDEYETRKAENTLNKNMRKADEGVKDFVMRSDVCSCFLILVIGQYQKNKVKNSEQVIEDTFSIKADMGDETAIIYKYISFTGSKDDIILSKDITKFHKENSLNISLNKLKELIKFNGATEHKHLTTEGKIGGCKATLRGFIGIKLISQKEEKLTND